MSDISVLPTYRQKWEKEIETEAFNMAKAMQENFKYGVRLVMEKAPHPTLASTGPTPEQIEERNIAVDIFAQSLVGVVASVFSAFLSVDEKMEGLTCQMIRDKFAYVRQKQAEYKAAQEATAAPKVVT
jgi:hypothetical protein